LHNSRFAELNTCGDVTQLIVGRRFSCQVMHEVRNTSNFCSFCL
jgi:hypothetical protein